jgi:hypothetical protein
MYTRFSGSAGLDSTKQKEHKQWHSLSATPISSSPPLLSLSPSPSPSVGWRALVFVTPPASFPRTQIRGRFPIPAPGARARAWWPASAEQASSRWTQDHLEGIFFPFFSAAVSLLVPSGGPARSEAKVHPCFDWFLRSLVRNHCWIARMVDCCPSELFLSIGS